MRIVFFVVALFAFSKSLPAQWFRYPALSPDGGLVAFTYHGNIYTVPSQGGAATQLVIDEAHDFMPVWSRDGKSVAFASNRYGNFDIFIITLNTKETKRLTYYSADEFPYDFSNDNKEILFGSARMDAVGNRQFPSEALQELYSIPLHGGRIRQILTTPAEDARISSNGRFIIYHDRKGRENPWRKHQVSSVARDIWMYDTGSGKHKKLSSYAGEDRNPVFSNDKNKIYWLSEQSGNFNIHERNISDSVASKQVTFFKNDPVRFLTAANNGTLCFGFGGQVYTKKENQQPQKIAITIADDRKKNNEVNIPVGKIEEMAIAPSVKELAFIFRGEVFAASIDGSIVKRITNTAEAESNVSFSPDGKHLLYASERGRGWKIIQTSVVRKSDSLFNTASLIKETVIIENGHENYQPRYSPDGKEIAFIEDRNLLRVFNIASGRSRTILNDMQLYSRRDHDQYFEWSPDNNWFLVQYSEQGGANDEVGMIDASGKGKLVNLTQSGYTDSKPKWMMDGKMIAWQSDRQGLHSYANSSTKQTDVYAFRLDSTSNWEIIRDKKERLTIYPSLLSDALVSKDGRLLYYLSKVQQDYDLWVTNLHTKETKVLLPLNVDDASMQWDALEKNIFLLTDGKIIRIDPATAKQEQVNVKTNFTLNLAQERESMFEHVWRRTKQTFYTAGLHGADWNALKITYAKYLEGIDNNFDFAEMLNELLGELNVSHTGAGYKSPDKNIDATASLGVFYDHGFTGEGIKIEEIIPGGPLDQPSFSIRKGAVILSVDGDTIGRDDNIEQFLDRKAGKDILLQITTGQSTVEVTVKGITLNSEADLLYKRWVRRNEKETEKRSNGQLGYVHLYRMNDGVYRNTYEDVLGKFVKKKGLVVDTRFNRGGDLAPELAMFLTGVSMRQNTNDKFLLGTEPVFRWTKPSVLLANEANYSDGHCFAYDFQHLKMGKLVGMPVPGSCTWMTGESLQDRSLHYSVPTFGVKTMEGRYMENYQTIPDIQVENDYQTVGKGTDRQLEAAIRELLHELNNKN